MNARLATAKNFVVRHKTTILVAVAATAVVAAQQAGLAKHNEFLKEKDLYDEFYASED